jgi:hypothetical protein
MMHIFDYFFYRVYVDYKKRGEEQVILPTIEIGTFIALLFVPIWWGVYRLFIIENDTPKIYVKVTLFLFYFLLYIRYKKKKDIILKKYAKSKYNKKISIFCIHLMLLVCFAIGVLLASLLKCYIYEPYHLEGILGK